MEKRRATNTYSTVCSLSLSLLFSPLTSTFLPPSYACMILSSLSAGSNASLVPSFRSFDTSLSSSRSIPVSLSHWLIPPHFSVARRNLYVRFTIGVLRGCHCFIGESWLYNEALPASFLSFPLCLPLFAIR